MERTTSPYLAITPHTRILDVGCGPAGALTFLNSDHRYAIDPLEPYFSALEHVQAFRDPRVHYTAGKGEALPYPSRDFDLVILDNVLDHCEDPLTVLNEIDRVLRPGGVIFFRQNVYHLWGRSIRWIMELAPIDRGHPHTFGKGQLLKEFEGREWEARVSTARGYGITWLAELRSGTLKNIVKALLFVTRNRTLFIIQKSTHT